MTMQGISSPPMWEGMLVSRYMKGTKEASEDLLWLTDVKTLKEQVLVYEEICRKGSENYRNLSGCLRDGRRTDPRYKVPAACSGIH